MLLTVPAAFSDLDGRIVVSKPAAEAGANATPPYVDSRAVP